MKCNSQIFVSLWLELVSLIKRMNRFNNTITLSSTILSLVVPLRAARVFLYGCLERVQKSTYGPFNLEFNGKFLVSLKNFQLEPQYIQLLRGKASKTQFRNSRKSQYTYGKKLSFLENVIKIIWYLTSKLACFKWIFFYTNLKKGAFFDISHKSNKIFTMELNYSSYTALFHFKENTICDWK